MHGTNYKLEAHLQCFRPGPMVEALWASCERRSTLFPLRHPNLLSPDSEVKKYLYLQEQE